MNRPLAGLFLFIIVFVLFVYVFKNQSIVQPPVEKKSEMASHSPVTPQPQAETSSQIKSSQPSLVEVPKTGKYAFRPRPNAPDFQIVKDNHDRFLQQNRTHIILKSSDQDLVLMRLRASKEKVAGDKALGHELVAVDEQVAQKVLVEDDSYPVVYREGNGRIGLLTGILIVKIPEEVQAQKLSLNYPMELQSFDADIGEAYFKVHTGEGLYDVYNRIRQNERVGSISLEVLDSYKGF